MIDRLTLGDYITRLLRNETSPVSMEDLLEPFGISHRSSKVVDISFAEVFARLENEFKRSQIIDAIDVAAAAGALGCEEAIEYLEEGNELSACRDSESDFEPQKFH